MAAFTTLNTIVEDLLRIIRGSTISASETISRIQVEDWVHQYRAILLSQSINKNYFANPDFIQDIPMIELEQVRVEGGGTGIALTFDYEFDFPLQGSTREEGNEYYLRTKLELPKTINNNYKSGFTWIGTVDGIEIQLVPQHRERWQQYKKYTNNDTVCFLNNNRLYFSNSNPNLDFITLRGIFENPMEVGRFINPVTDLPYTTIDSPYPIPNSMLDTLKKMILEKELNIIASAPSDTKNDSIQGVNQNTEHKFNS